VPAALAGVPNTKALGLLLYTEYLYPIEVAAVILLVAMIAAIALTLRRRKDSKAIDPGVQVHVRASDRLVVLPMNATQKPVPVPVGAEEGKA
jgi:NADH-quinone oxidoreductase subunit J